MHRERIVIAAGLAAIGLIAAAVLVTRPPEVATPSPSPASRPSPTPTATSSPSPTPQGLYMSKKLGYALELPPPWHKAICGDLDPVADQTPAVTEVREQFTSAGPLEEFIGHVGGGNDRIVVSLQENAQRRSMLEIARGANSPSSVKEVTFAGRPAVEASQTIPGGDQLVYFIFIADGDRFYRVGFQAFGPSSTPADLPTMQRIVRSFRFLSAAERQALPDPTPIPAAAPTAQALAGMLKTAFEQKDVAALERLLGPCVSEGFEGGGISSVTRQKFVADLRTQFANGLTVTVDTNAIRSEASFWGTAVRSQWNALPPNELRPPPTPGQARSVDLIMGQTSGGFYWRGTLVTRTAP